MTNKKKPGLTPEAAKVLEQYRSAGNKPVPANRDGSDPSTEEGGAANRQAPPPSQVARRSGTRGK